MDLWERWKDRCAWCGKRIPEDEEVWGIGARARAGVDTSSLEEPFIEFTLRGKVLPALITREGSPAKRGGYDFAFMACSAECAGELREAVREEIDLIDSVMQLV